MTEMTEQELTNLCKSYAKDILDTMYKIAMNAENPTESRIAAARVLLRFDEPSVLTTDD